MRKNRIVFDLNIPFDLTIDKRNDISVLCSSTNSETVPNNFYVEFLDVDTTLMIRVTDWMEVYNIAQNCAKKQWEARNNAKEIGDLEVLPSVETIASKIN